MGRPRVAEVLVGLLEAHLGGELVGPSRHALPDLLADELEILLHEIEVLFERVEIVSRPHRLPIGPPHVEGQGAPDRLSRHILDLGLEVGDAHPFLDAIPVVDLVFEVEAEGKRVQQWKED